MFYKNLIYFVRSKFVGAFETHILPANIKFKGLFETINITFNNEVFFQNSSEILVNTGFEWKKFTSNHETPQNIVQGGLTDDGIAQYIGRDFVHNSLIPGRVSADDKLLYISFEEEVIVKSEYEILVVADENEKAQISGDNINEENSSNHKSSSSKKKI